MTAIPKIEMKPTPADTLKGVPVMISASTPPRHATGICAMMMKVSMSD